VAPSEQARRPPVSTPPVAVESQRAGQRDHTHRTILAAAVAEFTRDGYQAASIAGVAAGAGVARSTVHFHFKTKADLAAAIGVEAFTKSLAWYQELACLDPENDRAVNAWLGHLQDLNPDERLGAEVAYQANVTDPTPPWLRATSSSWRMPRATSSPSSTRTARKRSNATSTASGCCS
jgi:AcrR family transcriptional regulator